MTTRRTFSIPSLALVPLCGLLASCTGGPGSPEQAIHPEAIRADLRILAADEMEGRGTGSPGGEKAAAYIADRFREIGLEPAVDGDFFQSVPIVGVTPSPEMKLTFSQKGRSLTLAYRQDFVAWAGVEQESVALDGEELVFVGYGIEAPEYSWDDYGDASLSGKVLLMLVNDPPSDDPHHFGGKALTYYGRWTYKLEEAVRRGAAGALLIHTDDMAGYPWTVVDSSWTGEQFYLQGTREPGSSLEVEGWLTHEMAGALFAMLGLDLKAAMEQAGQPGFRPQPLGVTVGIEIGSTIRKFDSPNVIGMLRGSDPELADQCVLYTSHYDHLGMGNPVDGDAIYNGARDNASGVATIISIAHAFASTPPRPRRSIVFAAVTAEESGLLGSKYYAEQPVCPLSKTAATINLDAVNLWGPTRNIVAFGADRSSLEHVVDEVAKEMDMRISPDPLPEKGYFFRSDHFSLVKKGVPAAYFDSGLDFVDQPEGWGKRNEEEYTAKHYHQPSDEYDPTWSLEGAAQMGLFAYRVGLQVALAELMPTWNDGDPFGRARAASLADGS